MSSYRVAVIGTGPDPETPVWGESAAMAYQHGEGYRKVDNCDLVACADLVRENAEAFASEFGIDDERIYEDYLEMLTAVEPDFVSICTPVPTHADIVVDCAETGIPEAIHCEKPMATTWGDCERMTEACDEHGVQLTFNHQRRFDVHWSEAKRLLDDDAIGDLRRLEMGGKNVFDFGSHFVDLCNFYNDEATAEWVIGQVDYRTEDVRYGAHNENQAIAHWSYENGVQVLAATGDGQTLVDCHHRLIGTEGEIEVQPNGEPGLRVERADGTVETLDLENEASPLDRAIEHVVRALEEGFEPALSARKALRATEIIFGIWESARSHGRIEFPLEIEDNPLEAMVEAGDLAPQPAAGE